MPIRRASPCWTRCGKGERCVSELVVATGLTQSNVSGHLTCLKDCGLVVSRQDGRFVYYRLADPEVAAVLRAADVVLSRHADRIAACINYNVPGGISEMATGNAVAPDERLVRYGVFGMDCPDDVALIEKAARTVAGVGGAHVSLASGTMTVRLTDGFAPLPKLEQLVEGLGFRVDLLDGKRAGDEPPAARSHITASYKRALWIVIILNVGYGVIEMAGGFLSDSQAVKADALDFVGDGLISFLGLLAIGWHPIWRARAALIQGLFLGALGLGVLGSTLYRVLVQGIPEAELMGALGLAGFVVNVAAALVLLPHRSGDANVRAVWLFSRNDAPGNLAVVIAAVLVVWTGTAWPDLVVACIIAGLFLHSEGRSPFALADPSPSRMKKARPSWPWTMWPPRAATLCDNHRNRPTRHEKE